MKLFLVTLLLIATVGFALGAATESNALSRQKRQLEIFENTRKLIERLVENLRASGQKVIDSIREFSSGIQDQVALFQKRVTENINSLRNRVTQAISDITDRFQLSGSKVRECVDAHRSEADILFHDAVYKTMSCADERIKEVRQMVEEVTAMAATVIDGADQALQEMRNCTDDVNGNFLSVGACLGTVAIQTEVKGASFLTSSGLSMARINLQLATLPAALEVCAGSRLIEAGLGSGKIAMEIGGCSATSIFSVFNNSGSS